MRGAQGQDSGRRGEGAATPRGLPARTGSPRTRPSDRPFSFFFDFFEIGPATLLALWNPTAVDGRYGAGIARKGSSGVGTARARQRKRIMSTTNAAHYLNG